jgi:hypothetical protein
VRTFDDADAYIALFNLVLAVGTLALWWSTRKLWDVTRLAADAARHSFNLSKRAELTTDFCTWKIERFGADRNPVFVFEISNTGARTHIFFARLAIMMLRLKSRANSVIPASCTTYQPCLVQMQRP